MSFSININSRDAIEGLSETKDTLSYYTNWNALTKRLNGKWVLLFSRFKNSP